MHFTANLAGCVVHFADFGEEGGDLVATEKTSCPPLQHVTQAGLDGSWRERRRGESVNTDMRGEQGESNGETEWRRTESRQMRKAANVRGY